jgi:hypothetical protein
VRPVAAEVISIQRLICTGCGAETNATCNCGMEYKPKSARAREAIEANPEKSNRAIAEEAGLSEATVRRARASSDAPESVTGKDGKSYPARRSDNDAELEEGVPLTETDVKERERLKEPLPDGEDDKSFTLGDYFEADKRARTLEDRVNALTEALNAKEAQASRNWPADMTEKQIKKRDKYLGNIAWWQRELEKLYGEVTGAPVWRVELITKDSSRLRNGARLATRAEAEAYGQAAAREGEGKIQFEVLPCHNEKANVQFVGTSIYFSHGDCVLLNWRPISEPEPQR